MRDPRTRGVGVSIVGCVNAQVSSLRLSGLGIGIHVKDSPGTLINNVKCENVDLPVLAEGTGDISITNCKATSAKISQSLKGAPSLPSYCPKCDSTFPSRFARFKGPLAQFWGNKESCPNCEHEEAFVAEGVFQFVTELIQILWTTPETKKWLSTPPRANNAVRGTDCKLIPFSSSVLPQEALNWIGQFVAKRGFGISLGTFIAIAALVWTVLNDREASKQFERLLELEQQQIESDAKWESEIVTDELITQVLREWGSLNSSAKHQFDYDENPDQNDQ